LRIVPQPLEEPVAQSDHRIVLIDQYVRMEVPMLFGMTVRSSSLAFRVRGAVCRVLLDPC